jgi:hypothetical protein
MLDTRVLQVIAKQMMSGTTVKVQGKTLRVGRTSGLHLKTVRFTIEGREYEGIEQNQDKPSRWGELARAGHQVVQFKDLETNRFVAVAVDGEITEYGRFWKQKKA